MIYSKNGTTLNMAYDANGQEITTAYSKDGIQVYPDTIKVMSYNVGQWYIGSGTNVPSAKDAEYYGLQNGIFEMADADIVCLCEYWNTFSQSGRTALSILSQYYPYIQTMDGASGSMGRAICSKYPITGYSHHAFTNSVSSGRYYDSCTVTIGNKQITVVVTHLVYNASSDAGRIAQLNELITFLQTLNSFVCCGDYNMLYCKSVSDSDYQNMMVPLLNAGFNCANCADLGFLETYSDQPDGTWTGCLDNIVTSSDITIEDAYVDETKLTDSINDKVDHMPLIAELLLP